MTTTRVPPADVETTPGNETRHVGKSVTRFDSRAKVTGAARYSTDFYLKGMLHAAVLFSSRPRARIVSIDTSRAEALPGVEVVVTGDDCPGHRYGLYVHDRHILARGQVRYVGEHVAAVAAVSERIAREAVGLIDVVYEDLPPLLDTGASLSEGAPRLHPDVERYTAAHPYWKHDNVCMETALERGDVAAAMGAAPIVVEGSYRTPAINHAAIEPHACVAGFDHRGRLAVWTATQQLSVCHEQVAMALGMPMTDVRVTPLEIGGGFGGKLHTVLEPLAALLARKTGKAVRVAMTREEEFFTAKGRPPYSIGVRIGVSEDGDLLAGEFDIVTDCGAYADNAVGTCSHSLASVDGAYRFPAIKARARAVYTNNPDYGCMRGYGTYQVIFALERHMDVVAARLGMDPADVRLRNLISDGDPLITGQPVRSVHIRETMAQAMERSGYRERKRTLGPNRGVGIANVVKTNGLLSSSASARLNADGTVVITTAAVDIGTGTHTILPQIAAEVLDVPVEQVRVASPDSDTAPFDLGSIASRTVFDSGNAVRLASERLKEQMIERAADVFGADPGEIVLAGGAARVSGDPEASLDFAALGAISAYAPAAGPLIGTAAWNASSAHDPPLDPSFPEGRYPSFGFGTHVVEVEVDPDTGVTTLVDFTACHDIGRALNPMAAEGQIEGGISQALGAALWEELMIDEGVIRNPNLVDYRLPTMLDMPPVDVAFVEEADPMGPFGAKGLGEHPILGPGPAVANAVSAAAGVDVTEIPITPERLFDLMEAAGGEAAAR